MAQIELSKFEKDVMMLATEYAKSVTDRREEFKNILNDKMGVKNARYRSFGGVLALKEKLKNGYVVEFPILYNMHGSGKKRKKNMSLVFGKKEYPSEGYKVVMGFYQPIFIPKDQRTNTLEGKIVWDSSKGAHYFKYELGLGKLPHVYIRDLEFDQITDGKRGTTFTLVSTGSQQKQNLPEFFESGIVSIFLNHIGYSFSHDMEKELYILNQKKH